MVVKDPADFRNIFSICIVGAGFASCSCEFIEHDASSEICSILFLEAFSISRIIARAYIRGKHAGVAESSSECQIRIASHSIQKFCNGIFKKSGLHSGCADASNLFFVCQETAACAFRCVHFHHCDKGSIGAYAVILSICGYHASVQTAVTCLACRNDLKLC